MDEVPVSADTPWMVDEYIPVGVITVHLRACSPRSVELGPSDAQLLFCTPDVLASLCAHEQGDLLTSLKELVEHGKALVAIEQYVLALWAASMYTGATHLRVVALASLPAPSRQARNAALARSWQLILSNICIDANAWHSISRDTDPMDSGQSFWNTKLVRTSALTSEWLVFIRIVPSTPQSITAYVY